MSTVRWWAATLTLQALIVWMIFIDFDESQIVMRPITPVELVTVLIAAASFILRTRAPWVFLAVGIAVYLYFTVFTPAPLPLIPYLFTLACGVYSVACAVRMRTALLMGLGVEVLLMTAGVIAKSATLVHVFTLPTTIAVVASVGVGQLVYSRRRLTEVATRRADDAELTREALASARVAELRLATARDLHDLVSHQVAAINLHAATAERELPADADTARSSIGTIQRSAQQILGEIADLLADLRHEPAVREGSSPGVESLGDLVSAMAAQGYRIELEVDREASQLPAPLGTTVYRVVQEGIVNAFKHGSHEVPASIDVSVQDGIARIRIVNLVPPRSVASATSSGYGLLGMSERVAAVGGRLEFGERRGTFELTVELPAPPLP